MGITRLIDKTKAAYEYFMHGVWRDPRETLWVRSVKVANLSVCSFADRGLQLKSMSLTYSTVLAIVPAFALLFAIGSGFGFQKLLSESLYSAFPAQKKALETALVFVDSYLKQASQGVFVGVGIVVLLWTLISLMSNIEDAFNSVWDITRSRSLYRKITDYLTILLLVPVLMICSSGVSIFISSSLQNYVHLSFITPLVDFFLDLAPFVLTWLAFTLSFCLIPNTKVNFGYAAISGLLSMIAFQILQFLFVTGQIYVSKYNAIYGSFAFLPLLLVWLQLSWLILLTGCVITYSLQNVFGYNFLGDEQSISIDYKRRVTLVVAAIIFNRYEHELPPLTVQRLCAEYDLPFRLVSRICTSMVQAGIMYRVLDNASADDPAIAPAVDNDKFTVKDLFDRLAHAGEANFIPRFAHNYRAALTRAFGNADGNSGTLHGDSLVRDIPVPSPEQIQKGK